MLQYKYCNYVRKRMAKNILQIELVQPSRVSSSLFHSDRRFDLLVAFESLQSLGMGRRGEGLHPWLDRVWAARGWCLTRGQDRPKMVLAAPATGDGGRDKDVVVFNSHKFA